MKPQLRVIPGGLLADADEAGVGAKDAEHSLPREVAERGGRADSVEVEEEPVLPFPAVGVEKGAHTTGPGLLAAGGEEDDAGGLERRRGELARKRRRRPRRLRRCRSPRGRRSRGSRARQGARGRRRGCALVVRSKAPKARTATAAEMRAVSFLSWGATSGWKRIPLRDESRCDTRTSVRFSSPEAGMLATTFCESASDNSRETGSKRGSPSRRPRSSAVLRRPRRLRAGATRLAQAKLVGSAEGLQASVDTRVSKLTADQLRCPALGGRAGPAGTDRGCELSREPGRVARSLALALSSRLVYWCSRRSRRSALSCSRSASSRSGLSLPLPPRVEGAAGALDAAPAGLGELPPATKRS